VERYRLELKGANQKRLLADLANKARDGEITLVFATHIPERSGAYVLAKVLEQVLRRSLRHRRPTRSLETWNLWQGGGDSTDVTMNGSTLRQSNFSGIEPRR
jgi:hypothetical protein